MERSAMRVRGRLHGLVLGALTMLAAFVFAATANAQVAGAGFTTSNPDVDGPGTCLNGPGIVNCNIYTDKQRVWINGGPDKVGPSALSNGTYFFAVLEPGGQPDPNDGGAKNLSDLDSTGGFDDTCGDPFTNRTFTVTNGDIAAYAGD